MKDVKGMRKLSREVRKTATQFAERCEFVTASRIKKACASCDNVIAAFCLEYRDGVERAQISAAFVYAAELYGLDYECSHVDDIVPEGKLPMCTIIISNPRKEEGK